MGKPEILVGKSNGSRYSVWKALENMDCDFRGCNVVNSLYSDCSAAFCILFGGSVFLRVKFYSLMFICTRSPPGWFV